MVRYGNKRNAGTAEVPVKCEGAKETTTISVRPLDDQFFQSWII
jgi:hypothetical protein